MGIQTDDQFMALIGAAYDHFSQGTGGPGLPEFTVLQPFITDLGYAFP